MRGSDLPPWHLENLPGPGRITKIQIMIDQELERTTALTLIKAYEENNNKLLASIVQMKMKGWTPARIEKYVAGVCRAQGAHNSSVPAHCYLIAKYIKTDSPKYN